MIKGYLEKGDTAPIENILKLTITRQEEYPFDKKANEADKNTVDLLLMEMRDYEKFNFKRTTFCVYNLETLQVLAKLNKKLKKTDFYPFFLYSEL